MRSRATRRFGWRGVALVGFSAFSIDKQPSGGREKAAAHIELFAYAL